MSVMRRRNKPVIRTVLGTGLICLCLQGRVLAQDMNDGQLGTVEKALAKELEQSQNLRKKSEEIARETASLRAQLVASAKVVQNHEQMMAALESQVAALQTEEQKKTALLANQREQFIHLLMALERLARYPPEAMIAQPGKPVETVRSALLLRTIIPEIEQRAAVLNEQVASLARAREQIAFRRARLREEAESLEKEGQKLGDLLAQKKLLKHQTDAESKATERRARELAREASGLRDLIARLEQAKAEKDSALSAPVLADTVPPVKPDPPVSSDPDSGETRIASRTSATTGILHGGSIEKQKGKLPFPVVGNVISRYGEVNEDGVTQRGVRVSTRPSAQVIATFEGKIAFVGEFRGYGQLLIIEHTGGYHSLLGGMSRIDATIGQDVLTGEPVGIMSKSGSDESVLYMELRRDGQSINPLPWLGTRSTSTQG